MPGASLALSGFQDAVQKGGRLLQRVVQGDGVILLLDAQRTVVPQGAERIHKGAPPGFVMAAAGGDEVPGAAGWEYGEATEIKGGDFYGLLLL